MDHISAVTDVDYAPTGREFVTGSYDKTVRHIFFWLWSEILISLGTGGV